MADLQDHVISARIATDAGKLLLDIRERLFTQGADSWTVKDTGDLEAHRFIMRALYNRIYNENIIFTYMQPFVCEINIIGSKYRFNFH